MKYKSKAELTEWYAGHSRDDDAVLSAFAVVTKRANEIGRLAGIGPATIGVYPESRRVVIFWRAGVSIEVYGSTLPTLVVFARNRLNVMRRYIRRTFEQISVGDYDKAVAARARKGVTK